MEVKNPQDHHHYYQEIPPPTIVPPVVDREANLTPMNPIQFVASPISSLETAPLQLANLQSSEAINETEASISENSRGTSTGQSNNTSSAGGGDAGQQFDAAWNAAIPHTDNQTMDFGAGTRAGGMGALIEGVRAWQRAVIMHGINLKYQIAKIKEYATSFNNNVNKIAEAKRSMSGLNGVPNQASLSVGGDKNGVIFYGFSYSASFSFFGGGSFEAGMTNDGGFESHGWNVGLTAATGINLIFLVPKEFYESGDFLGKGSEFDFNLPYFLSGAIGGNSGRDGLGYAYSFGSYYAVKIGLGYGVGVSYTPWSTTTKSDIFNKIIEYQPGMHFQ